jgi:sugar-specific transcriptional regulator TrmB
MWFRRRQRAAVSLLPDDDDGAVRILPASPAIIDAAAPAVRVERYVVALAFHAAQLEDRIGQLERAAADQADAHLELPTHTDLLEVRLHSSRVSADLGRLALELRSEVAEIKDEADRAARATQRAADAAALARDPERLVELAEELLEMADALDAERRAS